MVVKSCSKDRICRNVWDGPSIACVTWTGDYRDLFNVFDKGSKQGILLLLIQSLPPLPNQYLCVEHWLIEGACPARIKKEVIKFEICGVVRKIYEREQPNPAYSRTRIFSIFIRISRGFFHHPSVSRGGQPCFKV